MMFPGGDFKYKNDKMNGDGTFGKQDTARPDAGGTNAQQTHGRAGRAVRTYAVYDQDHNGQFVERKQEEKPAATARGFRWFQDHCCCPCACCACCCCAARLRYADRRSEPRRFHTGGAYGDAHADNNVHANAHPNGDGDGDFDPDADADPNGNIYADADANPDIDTNPNIDADPNAHADFDIDVDPNGNAHISVRGARGVVFIIVPGRPPFAAGDSW